LRLFKITICVLKSLAYSWKIWESVGKTLLILPSGEYCLTQFRPLVGDEEFEEAVQRQIKKTTNRQVRHPLRRIVQAVSEVMGKNEVEIAGRQRSEEIKRSRELVCYLGRRHGEMGLEELRRFLQVRELSTVSLAVKRAEARLAREPVSVASWRRFWESWVNILKPDTIAILAFC
jgi:Bacterial dnaA protein helix-turn-helix